MARRTKEPEQAAVVGDDFPYRTLMNHPAWPVVDEALAELEENDDLELRTARRYVIGSLIQQLSEAGLIPPLVAMSPSGVGNGPIPTYRWVLQFEAVVASGRGRVKKITLPR